jgi:hypothetical protein
MTVFYCLKVHYLYTHGQTLLETRDPLCLKQQTPVVSNLRSLIEINPSISVHINLVCNLFAKSSFGSLAEVCVQLI